MWQIIFGTIAAVGLPALFARQLLAASARRKQAPHVLFQHVTGLLDDARIEDGRTPGSYTLTGRQNGLPVQLTTVVDTLNVRKLPSLWLMVTIAEPLPLQATFDLMMRPSGPSTFSNFDALPFTIARREDFPEHAVVRTDDETQVLPAHVVTPHLQLFFGPGAKELLISPKGLRMVVQLAEGDRARYGVFRQAEFGNVSVEVPLLRDILDCLMALRADILKWHQQLH